MSPTVFRAGPFRFFFFSREAPRLHIHVVSPDGEAKYWIEPELQLAKNYGYRDSDLRRIEELIVEHTEVIRNAGNAISEAEVTNISHHGFWVFLGDRELFLPFEEFPWFKGAPVEAILNVERPQEHHLYWPNIDVDLTVESIEHPERFPLKALVGRRPEHE